MTKELDQSGIQNPMRDPQGWLEKYNQEITSMKTCFTSNYLSCDEEIDADTDIYTLNFYANSLDDALAIILYSYARGDSIHDLRIYLHNVAWPSFDRAVRFVRKHTERVCFSGIYITNGGAARRAFANYAFILCLESDDNRFQYYQEWAGKRVSDCRFLGDLLLRAFLPDFPMEKKYKPCNFNFDAWCNPILAVLALPAAERPVAMAKHMNNWPRLMKPYGYKANRNTAPDKDGLFTDFAFEVALAVCAYDIDDSLFCDHPYYPADLVQYYRQHIRHTRDAWRAEGVGAGIPIIAPPPPEKAKLEKSKRKGIARWIELACDGDIDALETVLETVGKPKKVKDLWELTAALSENDQALHADLKDDESLDAQASALLDGRGLSDETDDTTPSQGYHRAAQLIHHLASKLDANGYRLVLLDNQDDAWHGIAVKTEYHAEISALSEQLGIVMQDLATVD